MKRYLLVIVLLVNFVSIVTNDGFMLGGQMAHAQVMATEDNSGNDYGFDSGNNGIELPEVVVVGNNGSDPYDDYIYLWTLLNGNPDFGNNNSDSNTDSDSEGSFSEDNSSSEDSSVADGGSNSSSSSYWWSTHHIPTSDEKCIMYKNGTEYLPSSYAAQDCDFNCYTTCMEYCYNFYRSNLADMTALKRSDFETEYYKRFNSVICSEGFRWDQNDFLTYCGFDVQSVNFSNASDFSNIMEAISNNHPIMVTLEGYYMPKTNTTMYHEVVVVSYHGFTGIFEAIDPGTGKIHTIDKNKIVASYIINGYSLIRR